MEDLALDGSGALWAVGSGGAVRWDLERGTYAKYTVDDGLASDDVRAVTVAPDGVIWFGSLDSGVSSFDGQGWMNCTLADGLPDSHVPDMAVATDGALWLGMDAGVSRYLPVDGE